MTTKRDSEDNALYLIYFLKKDKIRLTDLQKIRALLHMRIQIMHYNNRRAGTTQYSNCQRFGHEALCVHCGLQHSSNYFKCHKRLKYEHWRKQTGTGKRNQQKVTFVDAPQLTDAHSPSIPGAPETVRHIPRNDTSVSRR
jgi:hypothetical protein